MFKKLFSLLTWFDPAEIARLRLFQEPDWSWAEYGDVGWWVLPEWREALLDGEGGFRLEEWRRRGLLTTVKKGPHRIVYRADLGEQAGAVYIKHFLVPNRRAIVRQWIRRGKARNEAKRAALLADYGVSTIETLAIGEQRKRRFLLENYLVSREIPGTQPLDRFLENHLPTLDQQPRTRLRGEIAVELGRLTARLHEGGFVHTDYHPGNVLIKQEQDGSPRLFMIDLDALRRSPKLSWDKVVENLAMLNHYFWIRSSRADRRRFLRAYLETRTTKPENTSDFARGIEAATRVWAERLWKRWGKRCRGDNKYFARFESGGTRAVASSLLEPEVVRHLMEDPDAPFHQPSSRLLKHSRTTTVAEVELPIDGLPSPVIYKRFNRKKRLDPILTLFRPSRAWRAWQNGQHLASRGVPTPQNLAVISRSGPSGQAFTRWRLPRDTYIVTRKVEPAQTLQDYTRLVLPTLDPTERRMRIDRLTRELAVLIRTLHHRSLSHRDLKAANILIVGEGENQQPILSLIDLVGVELEHPLSRRHTVQNLARLQISLSKVPGRTRTDSLRFLRVYLQSNLSRAGSWKGLWRDIDKACQRKQAQNLRRSRILT